MEKVLTENLRNVCLMGHSADGKTSIAEAMLYLTKATQRLGKPTDGNTVCDYDAEEIKRGFSISAAMAPVFRNGVKINMLDTPGYLDFAGEVVQVLRVVDGAIIVIDGKAGVEVGTELAWDNAHESGIPRAFLINKIDDPDAKFERVYDDIKDKFGSSVCPLYVPVKTAAGEGIIDLIGMFMYEYGAGGASQKKDIPADCLALAEKYRGMLMESIAETSEALMEKYFGGEEISRDEIIAGLHSGFVAGDVAPVLCCSATKLWGIDLVMDAICDTFPNPMTVGKDTVIDGDTEKEITLDKNAPTSIFVFKTVADPFVGKMSFFKVMTGAVHSNDVLKNLTSGQDEKFAHVFVMSGKTQNEVDTLYTGDIGMTPKLVATSTNDTLSTTTSALPFKKIEYPLSFYQRAIITKIKGEEDKITQGIARLIEEDPTIRYENNAETKQMLLYGQGDIHLDVVVSKLKNRFGVTIELEAPRVAYRETIKGKSDVQGKHKKQSGGHGQYGDVHIRFEPGEEEGLTFVVSVVGGTVPKNYNPAVEKGLLESMQKGMLAGYPVVHLKADLYDGSYHPVDSSEMAFKIAASLAYKEGLPKAKPILLEPIGKACVYTPGDMLGDVMSSITKRRGRVLGMTPTKKKGEQVLEAEAPMSEMSDFAIQLRAITQGRGRYTLTFERYDEVPAEVAQKIIDDAKKDVEE